MMTTADTTISFEVSYFTDPLCCWSWGMHPHLDKLQAYFPGRMTIKLVMGGLIPSWTNYVDQTNAVSRPAQMGPVWMHAAQLTQRVIHHQLWVIDPPSSSYPACIAVKCAALQSAEAGMGLFKKLQQAVMVDGQNIAVTETILSIAGSLGKELPSFDQQQFAADLLSDRGIAGFREDLSKVATSGITRFPSLLIEAPGRRGIVIPGYRTLDGLLAAMDAAFAVTN
jgi:protein-disulfide isomerase-like protein with CxxC motif